jgi:hypothetical protein
VTAGFRTNEFIRLPAVNALLQSEDDLLTSFIGSIPKVEAVTLYISEGAVVAVRSTRGKISFKKSGPAPLFFSSVRSLYSLLGLVCAIFSSD